MPVRLALVRAVADWAVGECAVLLPDAVAVAVDPVGEGLVVGQLDEADPDGDELADEAAPELLEPAEDEWLGLDALGLDALGLDVLALADALLVTFAGRVPGFGGRLVTGGRTTVTSPTTGNGLSGSAEAPSR